MEAPAALQPGLPDTDAPAFDDALYKSDAFRMSSMKVLPCSRRYVHDWTECPFAHPQEKARRRDPSVHNYTGIACPSMKKEGCCAFGDHCPYAHNVFEYWLHPTRYRTQLCNDGPMCRRGICFFAHSLEELRVPACKPYVSPEALARASLEAIQQNPHPLGQQLPNPVAAAQQQAAMAAMGGRGGHGGPHGGGMRGPHPRDVGPSGLAPSAMPFVPGSAGAGGSGSFRASGEPVRYSAPGSMPLLGGSPGADPYGHMGAGDYGSLGGGHGGPARQGSYGHPGAMQAQHAQQAAAFQQQQRWAAQQAHQGTYGSMPGNGGGPRGPPARGPDTAAGSAPADNGMRMAAAARQRSSADGGYYPSAPARVPSPADGHRGFSSFAAVQHPPPQGFGGPAPQPSSQPFGSYQTVDASQPSLGAPAGSGSVHSSRGSDSGSEVPRPSTAGPPPAASSGRDSPAVTDDLAQSLASLKIALTQQQLAAAAGSNHEVVISTLHQILKDAMAQQGGSFGAGPAASGGADAGAAAAAALYAAQQGLACGDAGGWGSPNAAAGASFGSAPSTISGSLAGSIPTPNLPLSGRTASGETAAAAAAPAAAAAGAAATQGGGSKGGTPPLSSSPDAIACYQAAAVAAAAGYPALLGSRAPASGSGSPLAAEAHEAALLAAASDSA